METKIVPPRKHEFMTVAGITTFVVVFLTLIFVLIIPSLSEPKQQAEDPSLKTAIAGKKLEESIEIPFQYSVDRFENNAIVLVGDTGEMSIPRDDGMVRVYRGTPDGAKEVGLGGLEIGNKIVLKLVFGEAAWLYIVN